MRVKGSPLSGSEKTSAIFLGSFTFLLAARGDAVATKSPAAPMEAAKTNINFRPSHSPLPYSLTPHLTRLRE
jgi:hypothetical protein